MSKSRLLDASIISAWQSSHCNVARLQLVSELSSAGTDVLAHTLSFADENVFVRDQRFQPDRTSGVQLAGGDTDFRSEPVAVSIGKAR
jgi:hypothetical protein